MIQWLYKYIFCGIGVLLLVGMVTALILAISSQAHRSDAKPAEHSAAATRR